MQSQDPMTTTLRPEGSPVRTISLSPPLYSRWRWIASLSACVGLTLSESLAGADWKPAGGTLMTRWGKKVTPTEVWPEHPRPQLQRKKWTNLNGLWDYAVTASDARRPNRRAPSKS